jgi:2-dehydro-3-deoxygalactonokinase
LIGAEVASVPRLLGVGFDRVALLGDPALCRRYRRALDHRGIPVEAFDGEAAAIAGLFALSRMGVSR